jgi:hypothetical protein
MLTSGFPSLSFVTPLFIIWLLAWLISPVLAFLVYRDAKKNNMGHVVWAAVVFLSGIPGALIYLAVKNSFLTREKLWDALHQESKERQGYKTPPIPPPPPDPNFRDAHLDGLIADGRLGEAHRYLRERIRAALEADDLTSIRNYSQYEERINKARMGNIVD